MNRDESKDAANVMLAYASGKPIQIRPLHSAKWENVYTSPDWDWQRYEYRVRPEPKVIWAAHTEEGRLNAVFPSPPLSGKDSLGNTFRRFVEDLEGSQYD